MQVDELTGVFEATFLRNSVRNWLIALAVFILVLVALRIGRRLLERKLTGLAARTRTALDDLATDLVRNTKFFFPLVVALYAGTQPLTLAPAITSIVRGLLVLALLAQAALWGTALLTFWIADYLRKRTPEDAAAATTISALRFLGKLVIWSVALLLALDNLGIDITALVTGLGIGGVAVALALQNVLGDLFASLSIVLDKPFVIGDFIIVDSYLGTVEYIGLKTTRVRSLSGEQLIFSNNDLLSSRIRNYKRMSERRVLFSFGVVYQTPHEQLTAIPDMVREIIEGRENTRFDRAHFKAFGDWSLDFEVVYYVLAPDYNVYMDIQQTINLELYRRFAEDGIDFAYPTRTLYLRQEETVSAQLE